MSAASIPLPARILVIDDNSSDVFLLDLALKRHAVRFELTHLTDGAEALALIRREGAYADAAPPDLILVDLNLVKTNGIDILREIRAAQHLAGVPLCGWSSSRSRQDRELLAALGVARFITKPSGLDQFMEIGRTLKEMLPGHTAA